MVSEYHAGPMEGHKSQHPAYPGLMGKKVGRLPGEGALRLHLEIFGFLYLHVTSVGLHFVI